MQQQTLGLHDQDKLYTAKELRNGVMIWTWWHTKTQKIEFSQLTK
jgi:hypothetical protein